MTRTDRAGALNIALLVVAGVGFAGAIAVIIIANVDPSFPRGSALWLVVAFFVVMFGSLFAGGFLPDGSRSSYIISSEVSGRHASVPEFLPNEARSARMRRRLLNLLWRLLLVSWLLCWVVPLTSLVSQALANPDADLDPGPILIPFGVGAILLAAFTVMTVWRPQLSWQSSHLRALRHVLPDAVVRPNRVSAALLLLVRANMPNTPVGLTRPSYVSVGDGLLIVWCGGNGVLTPVVQVPLTSITNCEQQLISLALTQVQGLAVTSTTLPRPLEICPIDHVADFAASAQAFARYLSPHRHVTDAS